MIRDMTGYTSNTAAMVGAHCCPCSCCFTVKFRIWFCNRMGYGGTARDQFITYKVYDDSGSVIDSGTMIDSLRRVWPDSGTPGFFILGTHRCNTPNGMWYDDQGEKYTSADYYIRFDSFRLIYTKTDLCDRDGGSLALNNSDRQEHNVTLAINDYDATQTEGTPWEDGDPYRQELRRWAVTDEFEVEVCSS